MRAAGQRLDLRLWTGMFYFKHFPTANSIRRSAGFRRNGAVRVGLFAPKYGQPQCDSGHSYRYFDHRLPFTVIFVNVFAAQYIVAAYPDQPSDRNGRHQFPGSTPHSAA